MGEKKLSFSWDLHWDCNYRCPYCWWHNRWDELKARNRYLQPRELAAVWERLYRLYGEVHLEIAGGEPTTYPGYWSFIREVISHHTVGMMTNLSGDTGEILGDAAARLIPRLKIGATFHPLFADLASFMEKAVALRKGGYSLGVLYLAYPPQVADIPRLKEEFARNDIYFSVSTFWGTYGGREYPQAYSDGELRIISQELGERKGEKFQTTPLVTKGKRCNAGHTYGIIHPDGEVIRCGGGSWKGENIVIGNIFDEGFRLWDGPRPCHSEFCPCNEWAFLLEEK